MVMTWPLCDWVQSHAECVLSVCLLSSQRFRTYTIHTRAWPAIFCERSVQRVFFAGCADKPTSGLISGKEELTCAQAKDRFCKDKQWGGMVQANCPRSCGLCSAGMPCSLFCTLFFADLAASTILSTALDHVA